MTSSLITLTERCVACALCLPRCPTFRQTGKETDSPRGRLWLMRGLAQGDLEVSRKLANHLDRCTGCLACEVMCPSRVEFGKAINLARQLIRQRQATGHALMTNVVNWQKSLAWISKILASSGLRFLFRGSLFRIFPDLGRWDSLLMSFRGPVRFRTEYPSRVSGQKNSVALFAGCLGSSVESPTLQATIRLLNHLGFTVTVPEAQVCCGAMALHDGFDEEANRLRKENIAAFAGAERILSCASACTATLAAFKEYDSEIASGQFSDRVVDINQFLLQALSEKEIGFRPLAKTVAVHEPCSLRNTLKSDQALFALLERIPDANIQPLPANDICCGGSGAYMIRQKELSRSLLEEKMDAIKQIGPDILVTANVGCRLQLQSGFIMAGLDIEVLHPAELLARQLDVRL